MAFPAGAVDLPGEFIVLQWFEDLLGTFVIRQWQEDLPAEFVVKQWQEDLPGEFIVRHTGIRPLFGEFCVHNPRIGQDLSTWVEYDPQNELDHDCNDSWWQDVPNLRQDTALMKTVGSGGLGSDFFHTFTLNVFAVQASGNGQEERICAWAGHLAMVVQDFYGSNDFEIAALLVIATDTADEYQLKLIEKGGNEFTMPTKWPNYQDRYIVIYKEGTKLIAVSYQDAAHTIPEDSAEITLSGDLNFQYVSMPMAWGGAIAAETSSGYIDPIFGSFEQLPALFEVRHIGTPVDLPAEFEVGQGSEDLPAEFITIRSATLELPGEFFIINAGIASLPAEFEVKHIGIPGGLLSEFIVRHETSVDLPAGFDGQTSQDLPAEFRVRCSRRFGGNWQRKMWHIGAYYWRGRYCPTDDRIEFEYIAEEDLALNTWTENVNARINAAGFTGIDADFTVRGAGEGIPTTILYSDGEDAWIAESDETSVLGWAWENLTKVFDGTPNDWYRKVNLAANRTTPTPRLWACAVFYDDLPDGKQWVKASRQSTGGDITGWDAEVPVSNINNTDTIYGCSVRSMGDAGVAKNDMIFVYKENIAIRSRYYDGDWNDPPEDIDTTTIGGRAVWDLEHVETLAGDEMAHIVYVDADNSVQWKERDPGSAQVWSAASELHAAIHPHYGVGIVEHGGGWSWVIWVNNVDVEHRLHICDPETWWPPLANPPNVFDPSTDAVITTSTIEQPQTPDSIYAGDAVPICWVGQTAPGTPCGLGWGILRKAAEYDLPCQFIARHSAIRDLQASFDGQVVLNLLGEFFVINVGTADLPAEFEVAQWQEGLPGEFVIRHEAGVDLPAEFVGQAILNIPAEFIIRRSGLLNIPAEFLVLQGLGNILAKFFVRNARTIDLLSESIVRHEAERNLPTELLIINAAIRDLPAEFEVRHIGTPVDLPAEFFVNQAVVDLLGEFVVKQWAEDLLARFEVGQGSVDLPAEFIVRQETSVSLPAEFNTIHSAILNLPGEFIIRRSAARDLPGEFFVNQDAADLYAEFDVGQDTADLYAEFEIGQGSEDLPGRFIIQHEASTDLLGEFTIRHEVSVDLLASFDGQTSVDFLGEFVVRHVGIPRNLLGEFTVRHTTGIANLLSEFGVRQFSSSDVDLVIAYDPSAFFNYFENVGTGFLSPGRYSSDHAVKMAGQSSLRIQINYGAKGHDYIQFGWKYRNPVVGEDTWPGSGLAANLSTEFSIRRSASLDISAEFEVGQGSEDLPAEFIVRQERSVDLLGEFLVRQERSVDLLGGFVVRHVGIPRNLLAKFDVGQGSIDLLGKLDVGQGSGILYAKFDVGQGSVDLAAGFDGQASTDLACEFCITYEVSESVIAGLAEALVFGDVLFQSEDLQDQIAESITFFPIKGSAELPSRFEVG